MSSRFIQVIVVPTLTLISCPYATADALLLAAYCFPPTAYFVSPQVSVRNASMGSSLAAWLAG